MNAAIEPADLNRDDLRGRAVAAARGDAPFDILISGGTVVDMVTGESRCADIGLCGPLIASVHAPGTRGDAAEIVDASDRFVSPGLIDIHMHVESSLVAPAVYAGAVMRRGVTTIVWDPHELGNVLGLDGVAWAVDAVRDLPLRVVLLAPSCVPSAPGLELAGADLDAEAIAEMLSWPQVGGIAEMMDMRGVIDRAPRTSAIMQAGLDSGKPVFGHARSLSGSGLAAFVAAGVSSDHELVSADDLMDKLRAGLAIELRGSHDHLLPEFVAALNALGHLPQTVTLCSDDVFPDDLASDGGVDDVVRRLVRYGLRPEWALRAATLNAAQRLGRDDLGLIAPGRRADIVVFDSLKEFHADTVVANGAVLTRGGSSVAPMARANTARLLGTVKVEPLTETDFRVPAEGEKARVCTIDKPRFTRWGERTTDIRDGFVEAPPDATLMAVVHRHGRADGRPRLGFLTGWGTWRGAFATTVSHDSHNLTVFGGNRRDMAIAANAVIEAGGGMAAASDGKVDAILPLPLAGILSDTPLDDVAEGFKAVRNAVGRLVEWQPPYLVFKACFGATLACNTGPHLTDRGIADGDSGKVLDSPILEIL